MSDNQKFYSVSDYGNRVDPGERLKIELSIFPRREVAEISQLTPLPLERLQEMRTESVAAEQAIFDNLREAATSWETQAAQTLLVDMAIEYARVPETQHTANQWEKNEHGRNNISNMVYQMDYRISEQTHYDREQQKSIPYAWHVSWDVRTNSPDRRSNAKIAGQYQKRYGSMEELQKYMNGRIKAYSHLFTEISPPIPREFAPHFKVNGQLLPGYTVAGEEPKAQEHAANIAAAEPQTQQQTENTDTTTSTEQSQPTTPTTAEPTAPKTEAKPTNEPNTTPAAAIAAAPFVLTADNPRDKLKEITDKLENGIKGIFESGQYKDYLNTLSKFHNYSFNNSLLIALQKPNATHVAGFNAWQKDFKRQVQKGEKGIKIFAPAPFKAKQEVDKLDGSGKPVIGTDGKRVKEEQEVTIPAFKVVSVFDVSQTDGEPLPQLGVSELTGSVEQYKDFFATVEKVSPVPVDFEKIKTGAKGYFHLEEKRIAINEGMSDLQNLKTLIHEIAHARIHDIDKNVPKEEQPDRRTREVEAESIAYTVCQHYGLDTSDYSFGYIAGWSGGKELDVLKSSLDTIRKEADAIITEVDKHFAELTQDKEQTAEQTTEQATTQQQAPSPSIVADQAPPPAVDLKVVANYFQQQNEKIQAADPSKAEGQAAFSTLVSRLEQANERIPDQHPQLKALLVSAAQSPNLSTIKERMATLNTDFVQHYSTAVQNTIDTSGKAEPPAAPTQQTDTPPPKAGEVINLTDLSDAMKKDKQAQAATTSKTDPTRTASPGKTSPKPTQEKPSIKEQLAAGKKQLAGDKSAPTRTATKNKNNGLGD